MKKEKKKYIGVYEKDYTKALQVIDKAKIQRWSLDGQFPWRVWIGAVAGFLVGMLVCALNTCS